MYIMYITTVHDYLYLVIISRHPKSFLEKFSTIHSTGSVVLPIYMYIIYNFLIVGLKLHFRKNSENS